MHQIKYKRKYRGSNEKPVDLLVGTIVQQLTANVIPQSNGLLNQLLTIANAISQQSLTQLFKNQGHNSLTASFIFRQPLAQLFNSC